MKLVALIVAIGFVAWANGANDNFKAVATLYCSRTLGYRQAVWLATAAQLAGSVASCFLAAALVRAFSGNGVIPADQVGEAGFLLATSGAAAATVLLAVRAGLPISTTHALIGGLVGAGLACCPDGVVWSALGSTFLLPLAMSPLLAVLGAALIYPPVSLLRRRLGIEASTCICLHQTPLPAPAHATSGLRLFRPGLELRAGHVAACDRRMSGKILGLPAGRVVDLLHGVSGFSMGFARGLNDTPKILALLVAAEFSGLDTRASLGLVAILMACGGVLQGKRVARTLGRRITELNRGQGLLTNLIGSSLVIAASVLGMPVSTTHVSTGAVFGMGIWTGRTSGRMIARIVLAWVVTLPLAAALAWAIATAVD